MFGKLNRERMDVALMGHAHTKMHEGKDQTHHILAVPHLLEVPLFSYDNAVLKRVDQDVIQCPVKDINTGLYNEEKNVNYRISEYDKKRWKFVEKTNFNELSDRQRNSNRGIKLGSAREFQQKKKELGFEEITKDDIDFVEKKEKLGFDEITDKDINKANKKVPNKKIGGFSIK